MENTSKEVKSRKPEAGLFCNQGLMGVRISGEGGGLVPTGWTMDALLCATGARPLTTETASELRSICTDTRSLQSGDIFVALVGTNFDGHWFVPEAVRKGAGAVMVAKIVEPLPSVPMLQVPDTLTALGDLAAYRRGQISGLKVIAITGSCGKTTVKEMTAAILSQRFRTLKTKGNFNNLVGLPLSILPLTPEHEIAVLEMGMNQPGEIGRLTRIADPDVACIVNVHAAHLEALHDISGVARAKGELFDNVRPDALLVVNNDDKKIRGLAQRHDNRKIFFGLRKGADVRATRIQPAGLQGTVFTLHLGGRKMRILLPLVGRHNVLNALAAAAMAYCVGADLHTIGQGLSSFAGHEARFRIFKVSGRPGIVDDAYNANPASMLAALAATRELRREHKAVAVLGDMLELGLTSAEAHTTLGGQVAAHGFDYLLAVGNFADQVVNAARSSDMSADRARKFADKAEIVRFLEDLMGRGDLGQDDWILVKGSHGMRMDTVVKELLGEKEEIR